MAKGVKKLGSFSAPSLDTLRLIKRIKTAIRYLRPGGPREGNKEKRYRRNRELLKMMRELQEMDICHKPKPNAIASAASFVYESDRDRLMSLYGDSFDSPTSLAKDIERDVERAEVEPVRLGAYYGEIDNPSGSSIWLFKGYSFACSDIYSDDECRLLIQEEFDKERRYFERLKRKFESSEVEDEDRDSRRIPEQVRVEVWRRDGGKCARCGTREKLEYDHIIPFSKGGSNTTRNIELLCESCNRSKSDKIE